MLGFAPLGALAIGQLPPLINVVVTMVLTEINNDIAMFGIRAYSGVSRGIASIKEIPATNSGAVSIEGA